MPDNLQPFQRSYCMSRVRNRDTDLEREVRSTLHKRHLRFRKHRKDLPGKPDIVFPNAKVAVFIDGDFWHGYRYPAWKDKVSEFWQVKIEKNRKRDQDNFRKLRRMGWRPIRIWQHDIKRDLDACVERIVSALNVCPRKS